MAEQKAALATTPKPPYYAVIFSSLQTDESQQAGYAEAARRMVELAHSQPGFLGVDSARGEDGVGITVSYWQTEADINAWKQQAEHVAVRERGRNVWYRHFELRVARVERAYGQDRGTSSA